MVLGPRRAAALSGCLVQLGRSQELDLDAVAALSGDATAASLADGFQRCRQFWARGPQGDFVASRRHVFTDRQSTTKSSKRDLADAYLELSSTNGLGPLVEAVLEREVDEARIATLGAPYSARLTREEPTTRLVAHLRPGIVLLGGPPSMAEVRRIVEVRANHADWRDRKVRRLEQVDIYVDEIWPGDLPALASARQTRDARDMAPVRRR